MLLPIRTALIVALLASTWLMAPALAVVPAPPLHRDRGPGVAISAGPPARVTAPPPKFETLMAFGGGAVLLMLVCWGHERQIPSAAAGTAASALAASVY